MDSGWEIGYEIIESVKNPDKVGAEYISYGLSFVKFDEEPVLYGTFHRQGNHLSRRINGLE